MLCSQHWLSNLYSCTYSAVYSKHTLTQFYFHINRKMADMDHICEEVNSNGEALEQSEGILQLIDQPGNTSGEALEQPEGIMQLLDKLETIVDQMVQG